MNLPNKKSDDIRVGLLAPYNVFPAHTGGKKFIALFYEYLQKEVPVEFIGVTQNEQPAFATEPFHKILGSSKLRYANIFLFFRLKRLIRQNKLTHLIIVHPYYGWLAALLKKSTGVKLAMLSHNIEAVRFKTMKKWWWKMMWQYEKKTQQSLDYNFFVTDEDRAFAVENYKLKPEKCYTITYGIEWQETPSDIEKQQAAEELRATYKIAATDKILLFNGSLNYYPNAEAVAFIINDINPILQRKKFNYKILICGGGLSDSYKNQIEKEDSNIIYCGFVDDINLFFKGADIFINPVVSGGGIKTKLVEALGTNVPSVSSKSGAYGIPQETAINALRVVADNDWEGFANAVMSISPEAKITAAFFQHFYWGNIAKKAATILGNW